MEKIIKYWRYILVGIGILVLYFLRLYHLTILPVFADEAIYIRWAQVMRAEETLRFLPLSDGKQPLFMWVMIPFLKIVHDPLFAGRFLSILTGFGVLVGVCLLTYLLFKSVKASLAAGVIYAVSPFMFYFDRMALADSMLTMFGLWTFILSYLSLTKRRLDFALLAGFSLGFAWLTKSPAIFFAFMLPTLWLFIVRKKDIKYIAYTFITVLIGYGMYNILRLGPNFHMIALRNADYIYPLSHLLTSPFDPLKPFFDRSFEWIRMMGPWMIIVFWIYGCFVNYKKHWRELLVISVWFLGPIIVQSEFAKVLTARYILSSIPFLIILASSAFIETDKLKVKLLTFLMAFFIATSLIFDYKLLTTPEKANLPRSERSGYLEEWSAGQGIRQISDYLKLQTPNLKQGRQIVVGTEGYFGTLPDGLEIYLNNISQITIVGTGLDFAKIPSPLIESKKSGNPTYLIVNSTRYNGDQIKQGLKLIASYPKARKPDGSREELLFFELTNESLK